MDSMAGEERKGGGKKQVGKKDWFGTVHLWVVLVETGEEEKVLQDGKITQNNNVGNVVSMADELELQVWELVALEGI